MAHTKAMEYAGEGRLDELLPEDLHDPTLRDNLGWTVAMLVAYCRYLKDLP